ncbi:hypothetical protein SAMN06265219_10383 [Gracilimonas mengyeensis]|uniref:Uncharacterized protein n=1 Tax=Gracilimonas mengyeensis TaxID=1302730 RepID=A0A521BTY1_9BACT|nr:hypothetical protein SAMN06265219_10383 [Gracilimonas mengyeensis]
MNHMIQPAFFVLGISVKQLALRPTASGNSSQWK